MNPASLCFIFVLLGSTCRANELNDVWKYTPLPLEHVIDITHQVDKIGSQDGLVSPEFLSLMKQAMQNNFTLLYSAEAKLTELERLLNSGNLTFLLDALSAIDMEPKLIINFEADEYADFQQPPNSLLEVKRRNGNAFSRNYGNWLVGVIQTWGYHSCDDDDDDDTSNLELLERSHPKFIRLQLETVTKPIVLGSGFPARDSSLCGQPAEQVVNSNLVLVSVTLPHPADFILSFGLFKEGMKEMLSDHLGLLNRVGVSTQILYKFSINEEQENEDVHLTSTESDRILVFIKGFINSWALEEGKNVVLPFNIFFLDLPLNDKTKATRLEHGNHVAHGNSKIIPLLRFNGNCSAKEKAALYESGAYFPIIVIDIGGGAVEQTLECLQTLDLRRLKPSATSGKRLHGVFIDAGGGSVKRNKLWSASIKIDTLLEAIQHFNQTSSLSLEGVLLPVAILQQNLSILGPLAETVRLGYLVRLSDDFDDYDQAKLNLSGPGWSNLSISRVKFVVWQIEANFDSDSDLGDTDFEAHVTHPFTKLVTRRQDFLSCYPDKEVILRVSLHLESRTNLGPYCELLALKVHRFSEAVYNWANVFEVPTILNHVVASSNSQFWWQSIRPPSLLKDVAKTFFVMRNVPTTMTSLPVVPCMEKSERVVRMLNMRDRGSQVGVTVDLNMAKRDLTLEEVQVVVLFAFRRFESVEILLGNYAEQNLEFVTSIFSNEIIKTVKPDECSGKRCWNLYLQISAGSWRNSMLEQMTKLGKHPELKTIQISILSPHFAANGSSIDLSWKLLLQSPKVHVGVVITNCLETLSKHLSKSSANNPSFRTILGGFSNVICVWDEVVVTSNENTAVTGLILDEFLFVHKLLEELLPNVSTHFRASTILPGGPREKRTQAYLTFLADLTNFSKIYGVKYFIPGFDTHAPELNRENNIHGWWTIRNFSDLTSLYVFSERESDYFDDSTWRPKVPSTRSSFTSAGGILLHFVLPSLGALLVVMLAFIVYLAFVLKRRSRILSNAEVDEFRYGKKADIDRGGNNYLGQEFDPQFELVKSGIKTDFQRTLGMGNFGSVFEAVVNGVQCAVKIPHPNCPKETFLTFLYEVKIMAWLREHENVVGFVGAYTQEISTGVIYVVTELCEKGSLKSFLTRAGVGGDCIDSEQLVKFAWDIASGMEYISMKNVVHGDLSTRNVLLDEHLTCKIADFGLSRKLNEYQSYVKTGQEALPWKWMAVESLEFLEFTTQSDVWSYGVTIWEVFSLGATPYPGLNWNPTFIRDLKEGIRMTKPFLATEETYSIMLSCWRVDAKSRPTFEKLKEYFTTLRDAEYISV